MIRRGWWLVASALLLAACSATPRPQTPVTTATENAGALHDDDLYRISAGDKIHVIVFGEDTLTGDYVITSEGNLSFPLVGNLPASGKTVEQLQTALTKALANGYINNPRVNIQIVSFRPFFIMGEVNKPGDYPASTGLTVQQAVAMAGGFTYRANTHRIFLKRADETTERLINLKDSGPIVVHAGDTIRIGERHF